MLQTIAFSDFWIIKNIGPLHLESNVTTACEPLKCRGTKIEKMWHFSKKKLKNFEIFSEKLHFWDKNKLRFPEKSSVSLLWRVLELKSNNK